MESSNALDLYALLYVIDHRKRTENALEFCVPLVCLLRICAITKPKIEIKREREKDTHKKL